MIEVPRDVKMRFPADGPNAEPRLMHNYEKMLWMKTRDVDVSGQGENVQKVSASITMHPPAVQY